MFDLPPPDLRQGNRGGGSETAVQQYFAEMDWKRLTSKRITFAISSCTSPDFAFQTMYHALVVGAVELSTRALQQTSSQVPFFLCVRSGTLHGTPRVPILVAAPLWHAFDSSVASFWVGVLYYSTSAAPVLGSGHEASNCHCRSLALVEFGATVSTVTTSGGSSGRHKP